MAGVACGSLFLTNLSDVYGRKPVLLVSTYISSLLMIPIVLKQDHYTSTILFTFLFGMTAGVKFSVSYMYSLELTTQQNGELYGVMQLVFDSIVSIILGVYFYFVKRMDLSLWFLIIS